MASIIILCLCGLLLIAYLFDLTSAFTKIPSVIFLLTMGWAVKEVTVLLDVRTPDLSSILPVLGTIGLILIVLEGALELELSRSKFGIIKKSMSGAFISIVVGGILLTLLFCYFGNTPYRQTLINVLPLCVISSAIAIPSAHTLGKQNKEFVIYESSFSDIMGVLLFNFILLNETIGVLSFTSFAIELVVMILVSFIATLGLSFLLSRIDHQVKFVPIILLIVLIYSASKIFHLPALLFILLFGLIIGNLDELKNFRWIKKFRPEQLDVEVRKFKEITIEGTFLVRSLFFLLFGYLIQTEEIFEVSTLAWSLPVVAIIFFLRAIQLGLSKLPIRPLLFIAPRGLITILLFLSIAPVQQIPLINRSLIIQVIVLTALVMMVGLITTKKAPLAPANNKAVE